VESMLSGLDFAINNGTPTPYSSRGELTGRLRSIDGHTIAQPPTVDAIAAGVGAYDAGAIAAAVIARLPASPTKEAIAAAVYAALVANPLSLH